MSKGYRIEILHTWKEKKQVGDELIASIREIDKYEMEGMGFTTKRGVMASMADTSLVFVARANDNDKLIACWGLVTLVGQEKNTNIIWALGTNEIERFRKSFVKESDKIIKRWLDLYGELTNTIATKNKKSIAWLKRLGAEFYNTRTIKDVEYMDFVLRKKGD